MPVSQSPSLPRREVTLRTAAITAAITADDLQLLQDLDAVAHLKRTTRTQVVADIVQRTLGPKFAPQVAAA